MATPSLPPDLINLFPASPLNHVIQFSHLPYLSYVTQEVALPGITTVPATVAYPGLNGNFAPTKLTYDPLMVTFMVDEEYQTHQELQRWLNGMTGRDDRTTLTARFLEEQAEWGWGDANPLHQHNQASMISAGLTIVNGAKVPVLRVLFYNVIITALGPVQFSTTAIDTITPLTSTATFTYDFYSMVTIRR